MSHKIYIANWKMYFNYNQAHAWCIDNKQELYELGQNNTLVVCPDFTFLTQAQKMLPSTLSLGAQNCASELKGAYTGEVTAQSLQEVGCTYCIVGHSERRKYFNETTASCMKKIILLNEQKITPLYCIGEQEHQRENPLAALKEQLDPLLQQRAPCIIAYEPTWAIGSGETPDNTKLTVVIAWIKQYTHNKYLLLYGGSVNETTIKALKQIDQLDGFLIGNASTDFQQLKKIVLST